MEEIDWAAMLEPSLVATEADWLASTDPTPMLAFLRGTASDGLRKLVLLSAACLPPWATGEIDPRLLERVADDRESVVGLVGVDAGREARRLAELATRHGDLAANAEFVRDVYGPLPFRPVVVDPSWRTADVVGLAGCIYGVRAFDRMPVLADALQDAGCDDEDILTHCRREGRHARGCWVVDLLLGKG